MATFQVVYERDEDGWWVADVPKLKGCHTQGRTISQARERIREAIALFHRGAIELEERIELPATIRKALAKTKALREKIEQLTEEQRAASVDAAARLEKLGVSRRDAGELLGLSHQRVQQLLKAM